MNDVAVTIGADTRADLEAKAYDVLDAYVRWCKKLHLEIAVEKTRFLLVRGKLKRIPVVRHEGRNVKVVDSLRYLGVILERGFTFSKHVSVLCNKTKAIFFKIKRVVRREYDLESPKHHL